MLLNFVDKSFDIKRVAHYRLSIQVNLNGFSFCVFDTGLSKHVILRNYQYKRSIVHYDDLGSEIETIFLKDSFLNLDYPCCTCIYISNKHTLIPQHFFAKEKLRAYLEFVTQLDELDEIHYQLFAQTELCSVFTVPSPIASKLALHYKKIRFINQSYSLIYSCLKNDKVSNAIYVNFHDGVADVALTVDGKFKIHNSFEIYHLNDAMYYLNAILHQFKVKTDTIPLFISGDILKEEIEELTKYFPSLKVNNNHRMSMLLGYENSYRYSNLLTTFECE